MDHETEHVILQIGDKEAGLQAAKLCFIEQFTAWPADNSCSRGKDQVINGEISGNCHPGKMQGTPGGDNAHHALFPQFMQGSNIFIKKGAIMG